MTPGAAARSNDDIGPRRSVRVRDAAEATWPGPFAWQDGRRLWILDGSPTHWVLAELMFDTQSCRYIEIRRASYRWPREAAGALLGRAFAGGQQQAEDAARGLSDWLTRSGQAR